MGRETFSRRSRHRVVVASLAAGLAASAPAEAPAQSRETLWVGRLGADTVVVEGSRRTGPLIEGIIVNVAAGLLVQRYEADIDEHGHVRALRSWTISDLENPPAAGSTPTLSVEIGTDSIHVTRATPDGPRTSAVPSVEGVVPVFDAFFNNPMALTDLAFRAAKVRGDGTLRLYYLGSPAVDELPLETPGADELAYPYVLAKQYPMMAGARLRAAMDGDGMVQFDARETTFKIVTDREPWSDPLGLAREFQARGLGAGGMSGMSPPRTASGRIGTIDVEVSYGQPSRRGRRIFPDVVPFGQVWRAGANAATEIHFGSDVVVGGHPVQAGSYSVWVIPGERADTLILNKATRIWGVMYDARQDLVRLPLDRERLEEPVEALTYTIRSEERAGWLELAWDDRRLGIAIEPAAEGSD